MIGLVVFLVVVFLLAAGFAWLADQPDSRLVLELGGYVIEHDNLAVIAAILFGLVLLTIFTWIIISMIWKTPGRVGSFVKTRRREKGWQALAEGVIAVGAGDTAMAKKSAKNSSKYLPEEPVTRLLSAQAAQLEGKNEQARAEFEAMLSNPKTEVVGLRGLYIDAESAGESEAARHFVEKAVTARPGLSWSGAALLEIQAGEGDFEAALVTLQKNADAKLYDKKVAKRLRAVLLTAYAGQLEDNGDLQKAKEKAFEAHRLAPELVPAATTTARVASRLGDLRKGTKVIETTWKIEPHPELMDAYTHLRPGDSGRDRLKRVESLNALRANHPEGIMGLAQALMDLQEWQSARDVLSGLAGQGATERVCLMMSEIEEGQYGDRGRVREWLARAVRAPRDPAWTADGYVADRWAPVSPISGEIDAFEWRVPAAPLSEPKDMALDDVPSDRPELPVFDGGNATTGAALVVTDPENITYVRPEPAAPDPAETSAKTPPAPPKPAPDKEEVAAAVKSQVEALKPKPAPTETIEPVAEEAAKPPVKVEEASSSNGAAAPTEAPPRVESSKEGTESVTPSSALPKDAEMPEADPIDRRPIDDPGMKKEGEEPQKRFRLF
ncbi:MAG: heme biosynthesis HemY N-terminal domain-containing protein [Pseudomonadota bacterium]